MSNNDLSYSGPQKEYKPQPGSETSQREIPSLGVDFAPDSLGTLKDAIIHIINRSNIILSKCDDELSTFVFDAGQNEKIKEAASNIWLNFNDFKSDLISYDQIKQLDLSNRSSKFLFNSYKKDLRKPNGSSAFDIKDLVEIILLEAQEIETIINLDFFGSNSSIEIRLIELLVGFTSLIKSHLNKIDSFFALPQEQRNRSLPKEEIDKLSKEDAIKHQSLFLLSVNGLNDEIDKDMDHLRRFFTDSSNYFYSKVVAPLVQLKNKSPNSYSPGSSLTDLGLWTKDVDDAFNRNVVTSLYDVSDRTYKLDQMIATLEEKISLRENYLGYIRQLQSSGVTPVTYLSKGDQTSALIQAEKNVALTSDHNSLSGRLDKKAHEQYLLKSNDYLSGDLLLDKSIKFGDIDISDHLHNDSDNSHKINGKDIEDSSITTDLISKNYDYKPSSLRVIDFNSYGNFLDAKLFWVNKNQDTINEVQVSKIEDAVFVEPQPEEPDVPRIPGYIPPFESYDPLYIEWITQIDYELFF